MVWIGFSAVIGSWNTMPITRPRIPHRSASDSCNTFWPSSTTRPVARAVSGSSCITASAVMDLPDPLSPITPTICPGATVSETSCRIP